MDNFFLATTEKQLSVFLQTRFLTNQMAQGCFQKLFVFTFSIYFGLLDETQGKHCSMATYWNTDIAETCLFRYLTLHVLDTLD